MKILFLIDTLEIGGTERSLLEILSRFRTIQPVVCHIYRGAQLKPDYEAAGIPVISLDVAGRYDFGKAIGVVRHIIRQENPRLLHTSLFRADVVGRLTGKWLGIPVISTFVNESYSPLRYADLTRSERAKLKAVQWLDALTAGIPVGYVSVSEAACVQNCRVLGIAPEKVKIVYRGREPITLLNNDSQVFAQLHRELGIAHAQPVLLNIGRLLYRKGQQDLIDAMPFVLAQYPKCRLLIAGEGAFRPQLEARIRRLGLQDAVCLLGERRDVPALLQLAHLFVFPSHYEGHPGALVEAMMAGKPIVASHIAVHEEMISQGESGLLVQIQDAQAIAACVVQLLQDRERAETMGCRAREVALERFHIDNVAAQYEQVLLEVIQRR